MVRDDQRGYAGLEPIDLASAFWLDYRSSSFLQQAGYAPDHTLTDGCDGTGLLTARESNRASNSAAARKLPGHQLCQRIIDWRQASVIGHRIS